ncbi:MAG: NifB/NifX family molybdenum-iron cluster-binding protein [Deltaproteobacteria bacterium]|nr:NifB/NifX family molybdenum-iron cluster-binding protein [Deltaproteobacteria bacterium]
MIIAVSAAGTEFDSPVDPRFGRCRYFVFYDTETKQLEAQPNTAGQLGGGAGVQAAQQISDKGAQVVLTGNVGPNAHQALSAAEITICTGASGTIREAVERYAAGGFGKTDGPTVAPHHGMKPRGGA